MVVDREKTLYNKNWLKRHYSGKSTLQIAEYIGCNLSTVRYWLYKFGLVSGKDCRVEGCRQVAYTKGFCVEHYFRKLGKERSRRLYDEVIAVYGGKCVYCGEGCREYLEIDHKNGVPSSDRHPSGRRMSGVVFCRRLLKETPLRDDLQLLCCNCNRCRERYGDERAKKLGEQVRKYRKIVS